MSPEDMQRFQVAGVWFNDGTAGLEIRCKLCPWWWGPDGESADLPELVQHAEEHTGACQ